MQNRREETEQLLLEILGGDFELTTEQGSKIIDVIDASPEAEQIPLLAFVLRMGRLAPPSDFIDKGRKMTPARFTELAKIIPLSDIHSAIRAWTKQNPTEEHLAGKVLAYMKRFEKDDERDFFISMLLRDSLIPYVQISDDLYVIDDLDNELLPTVSEEEEKIRFREAVALVHNLLNRINDDDAIAVVLWNLMNRQASPHGKFMVLRYVLSTIKNTAEAAAKEEISDALKHFTRFAGSAMGSGNVLGIAINANDLPAEIREFFQKMNGGGGAEKKKE
jgi:hypothetical protein